VRYYLKYLLLFFGMFFLIIPGRPSGNTVKFEVYSQEEGLSNNYIQCCFQDKRGFMWFGTSLGLNRFDGYRFTRFVNSPDDSTTLTGNLVRVIFETREGSLFIGTENGGLNIFNRNKETFSNVFNRFKDPSLKTRSVNDIKEDNQGRLWIATDDGLLLLENKVSLKHVFPLSSPEDFGIAHSFIRVISFDPGGNLWLGTNKGVFVLDTLHKKVKPVILPLPEVHNNEIWEVTTDPEGKIWIGTYENGIFVANTTGKIEKHILPDPENKRSYTVRSIARDKKGNYWFGTRGGIYLYNLNEGIISSFSHDEREVKSLSGNSVLDIYHDSRGDTWIGTRTGINYLIHSKQVFRNFRAMPGDNRYLNNGEIWAFLCDEKGKLWIGTEDGGVNMYDPESRTFRYLVHETENPNSLSSNCIKSFMEDGSGNLWIATFRGGINKLNLKNGKIIHYRNIPGNAESISDDRVWNIFRDKKDRIWVGTSSGLDLYQSSGDNFRRMEVFPANTQVNWIKEDFSGNLAIGGRDTLYFYNPTTGYLKRYQEYSRDFMQDKKGRPWIATIDKGLALYDMEKGAVRYFSEKDGLANNRAESILEDYSGQLWIGTSSGLSRFDPETHIFQNFSEKDGLQNNQLNYGAAIRLPSGELVIGGSSGFNIFDPVHIGTNNFVPPIVFTELRILNRRVEIGHEKKSILKKSITETSKLILPFDKNALTIEFAALNFSNSAKNMYSYYLEGFDNAWTDPSAGRSATYTNLNPGEYTFRVKSIIPGISDTKNDISLNIKILPPFWKTMVFRIVVFLFIAMLFYLLVRFLLAREKMKNDLLFERVKAKKLHELDMLKLRFFTNISHEIRTPLTLILGPVEKLKNNEVPVNQQKPLLEIIHRNARHLNQLFNQILDFRKLEAGNLRIELSDGEMVSFFRGIKVQFDHLAREKEIDYTFHTLVKKVYCRFDPDKTEKIISNLLSNAFKFTGQGGKISISLSLVFDNDQNTTTEGDSDKRIIEISVKDSGRGIPADHLDQIFNRFFQSGEKAELPGTGIGLALVKDLARLLHGHVFVSSKPGQGSKFTVRLPLIESSLEKYDPETPTEKEIHPIPALSSDPVTFQDKIMLVVEDNADVRFFIRHHFESIYKVIEAPDGAKGWDMALETIPDIILCDILMPGINGYELLKRLKNDEHTSHIPVILLTALGSKEHEIEGLTAGADDFISKPFDLTILQTKIENILAIRQSLKEKYSEEIFLQPKNLLITSPDERFMKKAIEKVEENMADPDLDIEKFASEVGISRMQLYRKLNSLTDMTVKEFIRDIRLKRAAQLLLQKKQNISEIAYAVGFRDLSHFRKCFRRKFGLSASEYADREC
jgi:signal transduction histidine kinase/ligand-binding sensor domain-containing protein/DNA-binding response OmpR family regulator